MTETEFDRSTLSSMGGVGVDAVKRAANGRSARSAWHDVFPLTDERLVVSFGDLAGEETDAAALMLAVRETFIARAVHGANADVTQTALIGAAQMLRASEAAVSRSAAWIVGIVDGHDRTFSYISAGHPAPFLRYGDGLVAQLPADTASLESNEAGISPARIVVELDDATVLLLYSAALVLKADSDADGGCRLRAALSDERVVQTSSPAAWLAQRILADRGHDSVALLAMTFPRSHTSARRGQVRAGKRPRWSVSWSFDATSRASLGARRAFLACLDAKHNGGKTVDLSAAELVFGELLGNVVRHAPGQVDITLDWTAEFPVLHVLDNGPGFHSRRARERLPADDLSESGRGLFIINAFATDLQIRNRNGRGTHASVTLPAA